MIRPFGATTKAKDPAEPIVGFRADGTAVIGDGRVKAALLKRRTVYRTVAEKDAYQDGRKIAAANKPVHERPNYMTQKEREAFENGYHSWWEDHGCPTA
jgi:hypothetical protein